MDEIIKPSAKALLWFIRIGLYFLFPPIFIFTSLIGYFVTSSSAVALFVYVVFTSAISALAMRIARATTFEINLKAASSNLNFIWSRKKEVLLTNVKEVELKVSILQNIFGLGTIILHTQASSAGNNATGLSLSDIENPGKVYDSLKQAVSGARGAHYSSDFGKS